jgi:hypothetical protein
MPENITHWLALGYPFPTQTYNEKFITDELKLCNCYFDFTFESSLTQIIDLHDFSFFVDSGETEYRLILDFRCNESKNFVMKLLLIFINEKETALDSYGISK